MNPSWLDPPPKPSSSEDDASFESVPAPLSNFAIWMMLACVIGAWSVPLLAVHGSPLNRVAREAEGPANYGDYGWEMESWDTDWFLHSDIPHGFPTVHMKVGVVVDRATKRPRVVFFHLPNDAHAEAGVQLTFQPQGSSSRQAVPEPMDVAISSCDEDWCVAVLRNDVGPASGRRRLVTVMNQFLEHESVRFAYTRQSQLTAARMSLMPFRKTYQELLRGDP